MKLELADKAILFFICLIIYIAKSSTAYMVIPVIIVVSLSCLCTYFQKPRFNRISTILFVLLNLYSPHSIILTPIQIFDLVNTNYMVYTLIYTIPIFINSNHFSFNELSLIISLVLLAIILKKKTVHLLNLSDEYFSYQDNSTELKIALEEKNKMLLERQEDEIHLATLKERNRIAREIHDNIGHLLSRALLQVGALMSLSKDKTIVKSLALLKESLSDGMTNIRASIHDLHDESIDLYSSIQSLIADFTFCPINFDYNMNNPPHQANLKYAFISIIKEALANIIKHSNAAEVSIVLTEHPIMYQLIISDNGDINKKFNQETNNGMGIKNMEDRVRGFNGILHLDTDNGFRIFITIPKKDEEKND